MTSSKDDALVRDLARVALGTYAQLNGLSMSGMGDPPVNHQRLKAEASAAAWRLLLELAEPELETRPDTRWVNPLDPVETR